MNLPGNTDKQAAEKLGVHISTFRNLRRTRQIEYEDLGWRTKRTSDAAIEAFKAKHTRKAIT